jgi:hypothetical protein
MILLSIRRRVENEDQRRKNTSTWIYRTTWFDKFVQRYKGIPSFYLYDRLQKVFGCIR